MFEFISIIFNAFSPVSDIILWGIIIWVAGSVLFMVNESEKIKKEKAERRQKEEVQRQENYEASKPFRDIYYDKTKFEELKQKAQSGDANSQAMLGGVYMWAAYDEDLGMHWFRKAADNGHEGAIRILADKQRIQQQQADIERFVEAQMAREQFVRDVNDLRKGRKLYY